VARKYTFIDRFASYVRFLSYYYIVTCFLFKSGASVYNAPAFPQFSFQNSKPGMISQIIVNFTINWNIFTGDQLILSLPGFYTRLIFILTTLSFVISLCVFLYRNFKRTTPVTLGGSSSAMFDGDWFEDNSTVVLKFLGNFSSYTPISFIVVAQSGILSPIYGVIPPIRTISFSVESQLVPPAVVGFAPFASVGSVGLSSVSLTINPQVSPLYFP